MPFIKSKPSAALPVGCKVSINNALNISSTGIPSLDELLGGGMSLGSLVLVKLDRMTGYGDLWLKYFMTQGIACGQLSCLVSGEPNLNEWVSGLPAIVEKRPIESNDLNSQNNPIPQNNSNNSDRMKIAWYF